MLDWKVVIFPGDIATRIKSNVVTSIYKGLNTQTFHLESAVLVNDKNTKTKPTVMFKLL